jgi:hypothetical protein
MFKGLLSKLKGIDRFYEDVKPEQIGLYQHYFNKVIWAVDVANSTRWSQSESYDRKRLALDDEVMEKIIVDEAAREGLSPSYLQIMVNQYFFADERFRELDQDNWVKRVLHRKDVDYFPDGWSTRRLLEKVSG